MGTVFFYLMDGDNAVCYWKGQASDFISPEAQYKWIPLTNDHAVGKVKNSYDAGMI